jgi:hypothetical protein
MAASILNGSLYFCFSAHCTFSHTFGTRAGTHRPPLLLVLNKRDAIEVGARAAVEDACALHFADFQYPALTIGDCSARDPLMWRRTVGEFVSHD